MQRKVEDNLFYTEHFKAFYLEYAGELIFFARKFVDNYTAEDIVQDIFLKIWDKDRMDIVYASIEKLPPKCRDIFKKAYLEGQKHTAIVEELNISVRTVETHIYKALKFLRDHLTSLILLLFLGR